MGTATPIEGVTWSLVSAMDKSGDVVPIPATVQPTLAIADGRMAVDTGCNKGGGSVAVSPAALEVGPIATTRMACDQPRMTLEQTMLAVLGTRSSYQIDDGTLTISNSAGTLVFQSPEAETTSVRTATPGPSVSAHASTLRSVPLPSKPNMVPSIPEDPRSSNN